MSVQRSVLLGVSLDGQRVHSSTIARLVPSLSRAKVGVVAMYSYAGRAIWNGIRRTIDSSLAMHRCRWSCS